MKPPHLRARYNGIMGFFARAIAGLILWELILPRLGLGGLARRTRPARYRRIAVQFRTLAIRLGGVLIKVGQFLSARLDILPGEITEELAGLQDEVPAEEFERIRSLAEAELGAPLHQVFESFDPEPLAAASLGQVHRARLRGGAPEANAFRDVVVKVQRPYIDQVIAVDFSALRRIGRWLVRYPPIRRRADINALIDELARTVGRELDYLAEGKNAEIFAANFSRRRRIHVPRVAWSCTTARVLTLENVLAIKITDYEAIQAAGIDRAQVAEVLMETYLKQIFEDGFFHADPHPGNLFVTPVPATARRKPSWRLTFVDFGMVGSVPQNLRAGLRELVIGLGTRNPQRVAAAYQTLDVLLPGADLKLIEQAEAQILDRFWGKSMSELLKIGRAEMHQLAHQFRGLIYEMPFQLPYNLLLLGRTIAILSGMCTGLDPDFNVWKGIAPYARRLVDEETASNWEWWLDEFGKLAQELIALPGRVGATLDMAQRGELNVNVPQVTMQIRYLEVAINRLLGGLLFASFLFAGLFLYSVGSPRPAYVCWGLAGLSLFWSVFLSRRRSPR